MGKQKGENAVAAVCGGSSVGKQDKMDQAMQEKCSYSSVFQLNFVLRTK